MEFILGFLMSGQWFRAPRQLPLIFLAAMVLLSGALGWLGWRLLQQDQQLSAQRLSERRETAADLVVTALEKQLSAVEHELSHIPAAGKPPNTPAAPGRTIWVQLLPGMIRVWPENGLLYYPELPEAPQRQPPFSLSPRRWSSGNTTIPGPSPRCGSPPPLPTGRCGPAPWFA